MNGPFRVGEDRVVTPPHPSSGADRTAFSGPKSETRNDGTRQDPLGHRGSTHPRKGGSTPQTHKKGLIISVGYRVKSPLIFGLKGHFYQPRAKPWVPGHATNPILKGSFIIPLGGNVHASIPGEGVHSRHLFDEETRTDVGRRIQLDARSRSPMRWGRSSRPHQHG